MASEETGTDSTLATSVSSSGSYYIGVSDGASFGVEDASYSINVTTSNSVTAERENNDSLFRATPITSGTRTSGQLSSTSDVDYYSISSGSGTISVLSLIHI